MNSSRTRSRNQRGVAFPSPLVMLSIIAIAMAGFALRRHPRRRPGRAQGHHGGGDARRDRSSPPRSTPVKTPKPKPTIKRGEVYVEVFNNSGIKGLAADHRGQGHRRSAGRSSARTTGTAPSRPPPSTTRRGSRPRRKQLALDLGIDRTAPAVEPMKMDRLTIVLTADAALPDA